MQAVPSPAQLSDAQRMLGQLARLVEISLTLNSTLESDKLLRQIIEIAAEVLDCEAASILLYNEEERTLRFAASSSPDPQELAQIPVPLEGSLAGMIFRENKPIVINDLEKDPRHYQRVAQKVGFKPRSLVGVPMRIRDRATGVLEALNKRSGDFTEEDVDLLTVIASQAAVAINNARLMASLQSAYDELSHIDKIRSDFLAVASHELRTPLGIILGYAQFLTEDAQGKSSEHAERVLSAAMQMRGLVEDMTNMTLLQLGAQELKRERLSLGSLLTTAYQETLPAAESKQHLFDLNLPRPPVYVLADAAKLERAFVNLLNNAVRFTPPKGQVVLTTHPVAEGIRVTIKDNGVGIPPGELENIFKQFYQVEDHRTRSHGGMGLGLAIARGLVELHGGKLWVESLGLGHGASFHVLLPTA